MSDGLDKMNDGVKYELKPVTGTNLFMIIKKIQQKSPICCKVRNPCIHVFMYIARVRVYVCTCV